MSCGNEQDEYVKNHKASGIKVGDKVRVTKKAQDYQMGWGDTWTESMDPSIGATGTVVGEYLELHHIGGFEVTFEDLRITYNYPYFVLEKVQ